MEGQRHAEVIPIRGERSEYINGTLVPLAEMSLQGLLELEAACRAQLEDARMDLAVVRDYLERRFPDGGAA